MFSYHSSIKPNKAFCYRPITQNQAIPMHESCQTCLNRWEPGLPSNAISRFQGWKSWAARKNTFFFDATSVISIRHANLWVQTHHHFDHSTRQNKTRFQRIFAHVNWVGRCCEICLSRHPLYHWPIDAAWKNVSEIFSIWGLCRCNFILCYIILHCTHMHSSNILHVRGYDGKCAILHSDYSPG